MLVFVCLLDDLLDSRVLLQQSDTRKCLIQLSSTTTPVLHTKRPTNCVSHPIGTAIQAMQPYTKQQCYAVICHIPFKQ